MSAISLIQPDRDLFSWPQYWAACFGPAPFLSLASDIMFSVNSLSEGFLHTSRNEV